MSHALRAGQYLLQAKARLGHGNFIPWIEENLKFSRRTASKYMALAENQNLIEAHEMGTSSHLSIHAAVKFIADERDDQDLLDADDGQDQAVVAAGKMSINAATKATQAARKAKDSGEGTTGIPAEAGNQGGARRHTRCPWDGRGEAGPTGAY